MMRLRAVSPPLVDVTPAGVHWREWAYAGKARYYLGPLRIPHRLGAALWRNCHTMTEPEYESRGSR